MQPGLPRLAFGGDYNPEQWPAQVREEDVRLMLEAGVDLVTVGVFSWALLEPAPDEFNFGWLDDVIDGLGAAGIRVDLATATASPPAWLTRSHPEMLPVTADGTTLWPGGRQAFCPSSPVYRERALVLCRALGERYGQHPALALWHVSNELGCHNALCYCDISALAFRTWLRTKYDDDVEALNQAWGTAFWSQRYSTFDEVLPPRVAPAFPNPTQQLDFRRFSSDELLANFVAERDLLHQLSPGVPVTTNFMVMEHVRTMDYFRWAREVDVVSQDHYLTAENPGAYQELAFSSDLVRGVSGGAPWILMEQSTSAVNWQPRNVAKRPGELLRSSLQHVARGADGILFFQWRASQAGAEKFHAGMLPHAGTSTRVWREVMELSQVLDRVEGVAGSRSNNQVAILFDWDAWWGCELDSHPSADVTYLHEAHAFHRGLTDLGIGVDFVHPEDDLSSYSLLIVPTLYSVTAAASQAIAAAAEAGSTVVVTYFSGIVDKNDHILMGGYPGAFRDLLGIWTEEFTPLRKGDVVHLSDGSTADVWTEHVHLSGADALATFVDGPVPGGPAITRHVWAQGTAWYVACRLDSEGIDALIASLVREAGVAPVAPTRPGVEVTRRTDDSGTSWTFIINHTETRASVPVSGFDLVADRAVDGTVEVAAGGVAVVRSP